MPTIETITFHAVQRYADDRELNAGESETTPDILARLSDVVRDCGDDYVIDFVQQLMDATEE